MYFLLILIILLFHLSWSKQPTHKKEKIEKAYTLIICVLLVLLAAFRSDLVGGDTEGYRADYLSMESYHSLQSIVDRYSMDYICYFALSKLFNLLGLPVQVWFGFVEAFYLYAMMKLINMFSKDKIFSLLVFVTIGLFTFSMAGLKQVMAMSLMMLAFIFFINRKYWITAVLVFLTYYTHQSALIFLAAFPLYYIRKVQLIVPFTIAMSFLIYLYSYSFMEAMVDTLGNERWEGYLITDSKYTDVKLIFYIVITFVAGVNIKNYHKAEPIFSYLFLSLSIVGCGLQILAGTSPSLFRLAFLYTPFMLILLPNSSYYSNNSKGMRILLMASIIFFFLYTSRSFPYSFF